MLKKITVLSLFALLAIGSASVVTINAGGQPAKWVGICHFDGHNGDFVLGNQTTGAPHNMCVNSGGDPQFVSKKSCRNGHDASPAVGGQHAGWTCEDF